MVLEWRKDFLMKQFFTKPIFYAGKHNNFISLFSISILLLGLIAMGYLLYTCHLPVHRQSNFIRQAFAKENTETNTISDAIFLSENTSHKITLSSYNHRYYYIHFRKKFSLQIYSKGSSYQAGFYSERGKKLSVPLKNRTYHLENISKKSICPGDRIFLKFTNTSSSNCVIHVQYCKTSINKTVNKKQTTPRPKKRVFTKKARTTHKLTPNTKKAQTTHKPTPNTKKAQTTYKPTSNTKKARTTHKPTSNTKKARTTYKPTPNAKKQKEKKLLKNPTSKKAKNYDSTKISLTVEPHFLRLLSGSKKVLSLSLEHSFLSLTDCTYIITNPSVISVENNTITAKKPGITVLYFKPKKTAICGSYLIRVT